MNAFRARCRRAMPLVGALGYFLAVPQEYGMQLPPVPMPDLPPAQTCAASLPMFGHLEGDYMAPHGTIQLGNDGGWCFLQFTQRFRNLDTIPPVSVTGAPLHGEAVVRRMPDRIAVAYRAAAGFTGQDHFTIRTDGPLPHTIPIDVIVAP